MTRTRTFARYTNKDRIKNLKKLYICLLKYGFTVDQVNQLGDEDYEVLLSKDRSDLPFEWMDERILLSPESDR